MPRYFRQPYPAPRGRRCGASTAALSRADAIPSRFGLTPGIENQACARLRLDLGAARRLREARQNSVSVGEFDLVLHLPFALRDETRITAIATRLLACPSRWKARCASTGDRVPPRRQLISTDRGFHRRARVAFLQFLYESGKALRTRFDGARFGECAPDFGGEMVHPRFRVLHGQLPAAALTPIYRPTAGLTRLGCGL